MITILAFFFVLSLLIIVHELGHHTVAKLCGIGVERFSIGFPPRLFGIQIGETDYCISAIPFGGYVKITGQEDIGKEDEVEGEVNPKDSTREIYPCKNCGTHVRQFDEYMYCNCHILFPFRYQRCSREYDSDWTC